ncbi:hypothetical protein L7F22_047202 [Adiantum nelumboides]|nr:hypothetical protein [Adiantum nelumboides]
MRRSSCAGVGKGFLVALWDDCINRIIKLFCAEEVELIRSETGACPEADEERVSMCGLVRQLCLWRGEERGACSGSVMGEDPAMSLSSKLLWTYGELPYILAYYAVGMTVTFCALSKGAADKVMCTDLVSIGLSNPRERLSAMTPCWHVAQLLPLLADACARMRSSVYSDYSRVQSSSCKVVEVMVSHVRKVYPSRRRWTAVKRMYEVLAEQRIPFAERLVRCDEMRLSLDFKPRGEPLRPTSVEGLLQALKCVCTALVALHNVSLMHRDVRWENVMKRRDIQEEEQWFLIDFDDAVFASASASASTSALSPPPREDPAFHFYFPHRLSPTHHAPEMSRGMHGLKVDVWGLGYLIHTCALLDLPSHLHDLQLRFMDPDPNLRPSIDDCLYLLVQLQSSLHYHHHRIN